MLRRRTAGRVVSRNDAGAAVGAGPGAAGVVHGDPGQLVMATALTAIRRHLGASLGDLEWTVNAYTLSFAVLATLIVRAVYRPWGPTAAALGWGALSGLGNSLGTVTLYRGRPGDHPPPA